MSKSDNPPLRPQPATVSIVAVEGRIELRVSLDPCELDAFALQLANAWASIRETGR